MYKDGSMCVSLQEGYVLCIQVFKVGSVYVWGVTNNVDIIRKYTECGVSTLSFAEEIQVIECLTTSVLHVVWHVMVRSIQVSTISFHCACGSVYDMVY